MIRIERFTEYPRNIFVFCNANLYRILTDDVGFREKLVARSNIFADGISVSWMESGCPRLRGIDGLVKFAEEVDQTESIVLFGSTFLSLIRLARFLYDEYGLMVSGIYSPPEIDPGFDPKSDYVHFLDTLEPSAILIALGAPKQEKWALAHHEAYPNTKMFCLGAAVDFLSGKQKVCPRLLSDLGLEWVWRAMTGGARLRRRVFSNVPWAFHRFVLVKIFRTRSSILDG